LPEGTLAVGAGLLVSGITAYGFLVLAARALGPERYAPLGLLWTVVFLIGPGFFLPVEQEVSRALADRRARGDGGGPLLRRAATLTAGLLGVLLVAVAATSPLTLPKLFDDEVLLVAGLALALAGAAAGHLARGACSGQGRFRPYAVFLGADGAIRLGLCAALSIAGVDTPGWYGVAVGVAPLVAVVLALAPERGLVTPGPDASWGELSKALVILLVASVLSFTLVNAGPMAIDLLGSEDEQADAGRFLNGLIIARVPLFLFQAVQASLLPKLSTLAATGRYDDLRAGLRNLLAVTVGIGAVATAGAFAIGPEVVTILFGSEYELGHRTLGLLALSCAAYMLAVALAQAVIALGGHRLVAASWAVGVGAFVLVTAVAADELFLRVELGLVVGAAVAAMAMSLSLVARLTSGAVVERGPLIEALHDLPLEP
jgi:O-antigen/teichoic acid export membrane protein